MYCIYVFEFGYIDMLGMDMGRFIFICCPCEKYKNIEIHRKMVLSTENA